METGIKVTYNVTNQYHLYPFS